LSVLPFPQNKDQPIYCKVLHNILPSKTGQLIVLFSSKLDPHNNNFLTQILTYYCETNLLNESRTYKTVAFASLQLLDKMILRKYRGSENVRKGSSYIRNITARNTKSCLDFTCCESKGET